MAKQTIKKKSTRPRKTGRKKKQDLKTKRLVFSVIIFFGLIIIIGFLVNKYLEEPEVFESNKYFVKGIDVSHHNPILNWNVVLEQNITFAYIKATEGNTHKDRNYIYNYELAKKANIKVGSYHFYTFTLSGKEQAKHFLETAQFDTGDLLPAIDVEHSPANIYNKDKKYISLVVNELKVLENEIYERFGVHPVIYTNRDCYKLYIDGHFPDNLIWMCDLHKEPSEKITNWRIWQFSHKGELPGIDGHIDLNYYRFNYGDFKELLLP